MRRRSLAAAALIVWMWASFAFAQAPSPWQQPASALAGKIADLLGPGQARMTLQNLSSIPSADLGVIQKLISDDLRARGIIEAGPGSANSVRVTLSESATKRLWVAEVIEGDDTQVAMIDAGPVTQSLPQTSGALMLRRVRVISTHAPVLATLATPNGLVVLEPDQIAIYARSTTGWRKLQSFPAAQVQLSRDPRGILRSAANGQGFEAWLPGQYCTGALSGGSAAGVWIVDCRKSDDPWLISSGTESPASAVPGEVAPALPVQLPNGQTNVMVSEATAPALRAFYNSARNYFTGITVPNPAINLPPFYSAAFIPRPAGGYVLAIGGIDGKLQLLENGALTPVGGARDWGSDFAALYSGCGSGTQLLASGSGQAANDSLRAYDLPAFEAITASDPLAMNGTVTALSTAPDGKSVLAVVRTGADQYEVDRVSATCN
ncbi:MAG TPA: hypothetical protein VGR47_16315 [Terracidiphilus sp.]|nr:hypothetical protein [Terracidiphilus sp.]